MADKELLVARNLLDTTKALQGVLDSETATELEKKLAIGQAMTSAEIFDWFYGTRKIVVKSEVAFILKKDELFDQPQTGIVYNNVIAKGWLGGIVHVDMINYDTLAWQITEASILSEPKVSKEWSAAAEGLDPPPLQTDGSRRPIYLPVNFIDIALCAA